MKRTVFEPIDMFDSGFHNTLDVLGQYKYVDGSLTAVGSENTMSLGEYYESGGAGLISTVEDYIKFARNNKYNFDVLVMAKNNPIPSFNNHHLPDLEYIVMIREKGTYFSKHKRLDDFRKFYVTHCKKGLHPAQKPIELLERFIRVSTKENDTILDCFMGSGTTRRSLCTYK